jgi:chemotaxis signal transduction protein
MTASSVQSTRGAEVYSEEHCIFECSGEVFAASLSAVREVLSGKLPTPVPQAPPALIGLVELHGDVLPVLQLCTLLGIAPRPCTPANPIVVLSSRNALIGVVVDRVRHVSAIDPASLTPCTHKFYRGWYPGMTPRIAVLDVDGLASHSLRTVAVHLRHALPGVTRSPRSDDRGPLGSN